MVTRGPQICSCGRGELMPLYLTGSLGLLSQWGSTVHTSFFPSQISVRITRYEHSTVCEYLICSTGSVCVFVPANSLSRAPICSSLGSPCGVSVSEAGSTQTVPDTALGSSFSFPRRWVATINDLGKPQNLGKPQFRFHNTGLIADYHLIIEIQYTVTSTKKIHPHVLHVLALWHFDGEISTSHSSLPRVK